jgi:hypothetical protein
MRARHHGRRAAACVFSTCWCDRRWKRPRHEIAVGGAGCFGLVKLMDSLLGKSISSVPELANRTPFAFVVDSLLVRATDYSVGHRDR